MTYTEILVLICLCIFVAVVVYIMVQITKDINFQIKECDKMAEWAEQKLRKIREVEE